MEFIKPNKPDSFSGYRDALTVNTWLYQTETYLNLVQVNNPEIAMDDNTKIAFASTLVKGNAANWWYILLSSRRAPGQ